MTFLWLPIDMALFVRLFVRIIQRKIGCHYENPLEGVGFRDKVKPV